MARYPVKQLSEMEQRELNELAQDSKRQQGDYNSEYFERESGALATRPFRSTVDVISSAAIRMY